MTSPSYNLEDYETKLFMLYNVINTDMLPCTNDHENNKYKIPGIWQNRQIFE